MNKNHLRKILLLIGAVLAFLPRVMTTIFNVVLGPIPHTIIFVLAVILLISGMFMKRT
ncbi:hypothetical protein [Aerococcus urinaeequi]|uniref:hypothetical protein n=1 Tax=Aerococcus urinaeequi TaxID=51665 RepID=UPI000A96B40C|nr:hypothetical protein [Aerococcus urinaeequi]